MPAIKKKWMKASHDGGSVGEGEDDRKEDNSSNDDPKFPDSGNVRISINVQKPVKRPAPQGLSLLKGLDGEVLKEKRKRFTPPAELKLSEWLDNNFEKRTEDTIHLPLLYKYYTELCQTAGSDILDVPVFNRMVKEKFGKTFGLQESSVYKAVIKERKIKEKRTVRPGIKLKDIVLEAVTHFGNPEHGVRFFALKQYIGTRYPALHIDSKPKLLKRALEMGTNFGYVDLVKGIGMAGYYRLPGAEDPSAKPKPKAKGTAEEDNKTDDDKGTDSLDEPEGEKDGEEKKDDDENRTENEASKDEKNGEATKKKKQASKKPPQWSYSQLSFSNPAKLEDTFPLAITYQSAPKAVGIPRIRRYIQEKYNEIVADSRWRKAMESGVSKGYWEHVSGSGITGRIHLLMDDFDPSSNQLEDMICAAIIACHEPKAASANQIKKYVSQYHTEFNLDQRPDRFKKALQKAVEKRMLTQLSGLGANGSFQLTVPFTPTPAMLAGDDDSAEEEAEGEERPTYVPRGTKSRGMPKVKTMEVVRSRKPASAGSRKPMPSKSTARQSSSQHDDEKLRTKTSQKNKSKDSRKRAPSPLTDEEEAEEAEEEEEGGGEDYEEEPEYMPSKSRSRGGQVQTTADRSKSKSKASGKLSTPKAASDASNAKSSNSKKAKPASKSSPTKKRHVETEDKDEEGNVPDAAPEYTPRKSKSRGGGGDEGITKSPSKGSGRKLKR